MANYEINPKSIPPDLEPDENITLWRYMSFSSLCEILMNDYIPLISVRNFSDKSEGAILRGILSKLPNTYHDSIEYAMRKYYETTYISSWHEAKNENAAMWDRYAYGGEGVAIKTNAKLLLDCIRTGTSGTPNIVIKRVEYTDKNPADFAMAEKNLRNRRYDALCFFYKLEDFKDESEIRILKSVFSNPYALASIEASAVFKVDDALKKVLPLEDAVQLKIDSAGKFIQKIVVSPYAHNRFIETVRQSIICINMYRQQLQTDLIECDVIESRRKEWV